VKKGNQETAAERELEEEEEMRAQLEEAAKKGMQKFAKASTPAEKLGGASEKRGDSSAKPGGSSEKPRGSSVKPGGSSDEQGKIFFILQ
jgi:hypothetical protein